MVAFKLELNAAEVRRLGLATAEVRVTDVTRRVFNRANILTPVDTGRLRAGNHFAFRRTRTTYVGTVFNNTSYASAVHDGSKAHVIRPKSTQLKTIRPRTAKALRFEINGRVVYAKSVRVPPTLRFVIGGRVVHAREVHMPARRGRPWMLRALREIAEPAGFKVTTP